MKCIIYKPYQMDKFEIYMESVCISFLSWIFIEGLLQGVDTAICFGGISIVCLIFCIKDTLSRIMLVICLEEKGIHIIDGGRKKNHFISWEDFSYGYYCLNRRGHSYLVLTDKKMSNRQTRKLVQSSLEKQFADGNAVIRLFIVRKEEKEQIEKIKEIILEKVPNIREYKYFD